MRVMREEFQGTTLTSQWFRDNRSRKRQDTTYGTEEGWPVRRGNQQILEAEWRQYPEGLWHLDMCYQWLREDKPWELMMEYDNRGVIDNLDKTSVGGKVGPKPDVGWESRKKWEGRNWNKPRQLFLEGMGAGESYWRKLGNMDGFNQIFESVKVEYLVYIN